MKKLLNILVMAVFPIAIIILLAIYIFIPKKNQYPGYKIISYQLENKNYRFLVADTESKWTKGLMYYRKLTGVDGMIFEFPDKDYRSFWNENTLMDLDLYWLNDKKIVGKSELPSIEKSRQLVTVNSPDLVNIVIEMPH